MKSFRIRQRLVLSGALTLLMSATVFVGAQVVDGLRANAAPVGPATRPIAARRLAPVAIPGLPAVTRRTVPPEPIPTVAPRPTPKAAPVRVVTPPTTCAGVVASIAWPQGWRVQCNGPREGLLGATQPGGITDLFVRADEPVNELRVVALHEAGHAWDFARLNPALIVQWCTARGCDASRFFEGAVSSEGWAEPSGAEDWAAAWDACHGGEYHRSYMGLSAPTPAQCALQDTLVGYPR